MTATQFFHMGGYAFYVWTSYGLAFIVLLINILLPWRHERRLLREIARKTRRARRRVE